MFLLLAESVVPGQKFVVNSRSFKAHKAEELCGVGHMLTTDTCGRIYRIYKFHLFNLYS